MKAESEASSRTQKVLVLGLDGMPLYLLHFLMEQGITPNLKALFERGSHGKLKSVIPPSLRRRGRRFRQASIQISMGLLISLWKNRGPTSMSSQTAPASPARHSGKF